VSSRTARATQRNPVSKQPKRKKKKKMYTESQVWWHKAVMLALERWRRRITEASLHYTASFRPAWVT
jgi:hypothetical protein